MIRSGPRQILGLAVSILVVMLAAGTGGFFTGQSVATWYRTLNRPDWTPPSWVFGPAWTLLYFTMAVAAWTVWRHGGSGLKGAMWAFAIQLALNVAWSGLFFGLQSPLAGLVDIALLWIAIVVTIACFMRVTKWAGLLLVPYLLWVSFAATLNLAIWRMN